MDGIKPGCSLSYSRVWHIILHKMFFITTKLIEDYSSKTPCYSFINKSIM